MRVVTAFFCLCVLPLLCVTASAAGPGDDAVWIAPVPTATITAGFYDKSYAKSEKRQHLGLDLAAQAGSEVRSPVSGQVTLNATDAANVMEAYLLIREDGSGAEHVLGHISSDVREGDRVGRGRVVGTVRAWPGQPTRSHVHWGVNRDAIKANAWPQGLGDWGWGRASLAITQAQALKAGWVNLSAFVPGREVIEAPPARLDLIPHPVSTVGTRCGPSASVGMETGRIYTTIEGWNPARGWQSDGGCFFVFHGLVPVFEGNAPEIATGWQGLRTIPGVQSYQVMYAGPNQIVAWVWGPFDAARVRQYLTTARQPVPLMLARICCAPQ